MPRDPALPAEAARAALWRFTSVLILLVLMILVTSCGDDGAKPAVDSTRPGTVQDLAAAGSADSTVLLTWTAPGDDGTEGQAAHYDVRYATDVITEQNWTSATAADSIPVPRLAGQPESLSVTGLGSGNWRFALKTADETPNWSALSNVASTVLGDLVPPAQVTDLRVSSMSGQSVTLSWTAPGDDGGMGQATEYDLRYASTPITEQNWSATTRVPDVPPPDLAGTAQSWTVGSLVTQRGYFFALKTADEIPSWSVLSNVSSAALGLLRLTTGSGSGWGAYYKDWSPDGATIVFSADWMGQTEIYTVPAAGGTPTRLTNHSEDDFAPSWSPDERKIAFTSRRGAGKAELWVMDAVPGAQPVRAASHAQDISSCDWSPDGTHIAYDVMVSWSPARSQICIVSLPGGVPEVLVDHPSVNAEPAWSPDGSRIAFTSTRGGNHDIWIIPANGGLAVQVTGSLAADGDPDWSPDGGRIVFYSNRSGNFDIWTMSTEGGDVRQVTIDPAMDSNPIWSPDGSRIAFSSTRSGQGEIWSQQLD